ncbi:MAG: lysine--tRNA ligase [Syntrophales bacterium]|jgi:lysyl-tRNA synthetase class 2|nr:lysine--tRNA ligase [Syntrophales bacterium]NLN59977.1 lysine--tRNA ligase [Deltaproteobacteria bacterium]
MEESELLKRRLEKIESLKEDGIALYPNRFRYKDNAAALLARFENKENDVLSEVNEIFTVAGRLMAVRDFGKAAFVKVQDRTGSIQGYINHVILGDDEFGLYRRLDIGDIIAMGGRIFRTRTDELTIEVTDLCLLSKAIRPLPEKWHGLTDVETRYRQRHLDLISNAKSREVFQRRSRIIQFIRHFMEKRDFMEVETPMMQPKAGGAMAKPFKTFHNALGMDFYLRIAPELYLKRLITGGMERVFEINRSFRNEGISTSHNPEFTMMEFYQAYATYEDLMTLTEEMFTALAQRIFGSEKFIYQGTEIDLTRPWKRLTVREAIMEHCGIPASVLEDAVEATAYARKHGIDVPDNAPLGKVIMAIFDAKVEDRIIQPTFVTQYPIEVSPLARKNDADPAYTDRFELIIHGKEIANAFSELNDPVDQRERFLNQLQQREEGDEEAHVMDEDYIAVLEYGMPPTAGEGIGIDRLVMLFTDSASIRDVILFPHMRTKEG